MSLSSADAVFVEDSGERDSMMWQILRTVITLLVIFEAKMMPRAEDVGSSMNVEAVGKTGNNSDLAKSQGSAG